MLSVSVYLSLSLPPRPRGTLCVHFILSRTIQTDAATGALDLTHFNAQAKHYRHASYKDKSKHSPKWAGWELRAADTPEHTNDSPLDSQEYQDVRPEKKALPGHARTHHKPKDDDQSLSLSDHRPGGAEC